VTAQLAQSPLPLVLLASLIALFGSAELGRYLGGRASRRGADTSSPTLESAMLGLLALMLGFTFSVALARYEARRDAVLKEANAIGTTALRAVLLPSPHSERVLAKLHDYLQLRLNLVPRAMTAAQVSAAIAQSNAIQEAIWQEVKNITVQNQNTAFLNVFIIGLNEMIDDQENTVIAAQSHLPPSVLFTLYATAITAIFFSGYNRGLQQLRRHLPIYAMATITAMIILLIQDLDRPRSGYIVTNLQPLADAANNFPSQSQP
jgi:hypothetical protein